MIVVKIGNQFRILLIFLIKYNKYDINSYFCIIIFLFIIIYGIDSKQTWFPALLSRIRALFL
ncbi:hypothetical protein TREPR_2486 [Treponema primitia ZAS-2]|uniref:Uncharacterized protein n=1 Tax=Treponema primitia (strain ATCC BAA-887 / DSM 12427 / ZAS-2) TaxID=545694 RepID=F5YH20_TREPZ|nr:hypothetical protein TREPR_2486 [Treponema primitia ZAS-2]